MSRYSPLVPISLTLLASIGMSQAQTTVDCSEYQVAHAFAGTPISMEYVVTVDDNNSNNATSNPTATRGLFSAQVTYEGQGYVGFGFSPDGRMTGSLAVVGLPDQPPSATNPGKYDMTSTSTSGVTLVEDAQQTLVDATVVQNETHTVLTFSKYLQEEGDLVSIDPAGSNFFVVAAGYSNSLGPHLHRAAVGLTLAPCQHGALVSNTTTSGVVQVTIDNKQSLFQAHGVMAALAWGILAPLAIANVMCRHLIPGAGMWFQLHRGLNGVVLVLTIVSFALVVKAFNDLSAGGSANHFESNPGAMGKHRTIGLVVFILVILQSIGGMMRPHAAQKASPGKVAEKPTTLRVMWEYGHRLSGMALLAMAWYQCHSGFVLYAQRFVEDDYTGIFWAITGAISGMAVLGKVHGVVTADQDSSDADQQHVPEEEATGELHL